MLLLLGYRFDSGSSWAGVLSRDGLTLPADLYLEGSDQHRGTLPSIPNWKLSVRCLLLCSTHGRCRGQRLCDDGCMYWTWG